MPRRIERFPCTLIWLEPWEPGVVDEAACSFRLSLRRPFRRDECCMTPVASRLECPAVVLLDCVSWACCWREAHALPELC